MLVVAVVLAHLCLPVLVAFVLAYSPQVLVELEQKVNDLIAQDLPIAYVDENHISIGGKLHKCNGPRVHVHHTGQIENFHLMHHFIYDPFKRRYMLVGCVGEQSEELLKKLDVKRQRPGWD